MNGDHGQSTVTMASTGSVDVGDWISMPAREQWRVFGFKIATRRRWPWILVWRTRAPMQSFRITKVSSTIITVDE